MKNYSKEEIMKLGKKTQLNCTAYCNDPITATGEKPIINKTCAVDPKYIPYNSLIYIPSLNMIVRANDCGSKVKGNGRLDLYLKDYKTCIQFGVKKLEGYILTPQNMK